VIVVTAFDSDGAVLAQLDVPVRVFSDPDNREGFWAVTTHIPAISKITILNLETANFGNTLIIDNIAWSTTPPALAAITETSSAVLSNGGIESDRPAASLAPTVDWVVLNLDRESTAFRRWGTPSDADRIIAQTAIDRAITASGVLFESKVSGSSDDLWQSGLDLPSGRLNKDAWQDDYDVALSEFGVLIDDLWEVLAPAGRSQ
jgi:hypothetical protein